MSQISSLIINDKLISNQDLLNKGKDALNKKTQGELRDIVKNKMKLVEHLNEKYKMKSQEIKDSNSDEKLKESELNDLALEYYIKRKNLEHSFLTTLIG